MDKTVSPFAIRERRLKGIGIRRQRLGYDVVELDFAERPACLLVGQNVLQADHIASQFLDVVRDIEYTLVVRGSVDAATVDVWEIPERSFSGAETIFEMRIGHTVEALGTVDVYIGLASAAPDLGDLAATLAPGEVSAPTDIEEDVYIVTITAAGDPADVLFESVPTQIVANQSALITVFEGDANDTAPVSVRVFNERGLSSTLADARFPPTARFIHASSDLGTSDIFDDTALQNRIVADPACDDILTDAPIQCVVASAATQQIIARITGHPDAARRSRNSRT